MMNLEQISHETMVFMRGKYRLDEIGDGKDVLKFMQGRRTILTIYIHEDRYSFLIIFGKKERESFERQRSEFSGEIQKRYDDAKTYHDGKWVIFDVDTPEQLEEIKKLISIKKKPNREPFLKACALKKELAECRECADFPCIRATSADYRSMIHTEIHFADEITWGILPYVPWQYEERG